MQLCVGDLSFSRSFDATALPRSVCTCTLGSCLLLFEVSFVLMTDEARKVGTSTRLHPRKRLASVLQVAATPFVSRSTQGLFSLTGWFLKWRYTWCVQVLRSPKEAFAAAMQSWRERCEKCVCLQGDYVKK